MKKLVVSAWVGTMDRTPLREAGIVVQDGKIVEVGRAKELRRRHEDAVMHEMGEAIVLPGLVNAHTHLELSGIRRAGGSPGSFAEWIVGLRNRAREQLGDAEAVERAVARGIAESFRFGISTVGDIARGCTAAREALVRSPLRAVSFGEIIALGKLRESFEEQLRVAGDLSVQNDRLRIGISPHAPYTVEIEQYRACVQTRLPIATHLAETREESEFVSEHAGPLRGVWDAVGLWDEPKSRFNGGPIRFAREVGLLDVPAVLTHVNYCDDEELEILNKRKASVVLCPRTHAYFAHPPHRWREMLERGINVAVGTDSSASSPDLNIVDDLRLLHEQSREVPVMTLWEMATVRAAQALGMQDEVGTITRGKAADFVVFDAMTHDPLSELLENMVLPRELWIAGERVSASPGRRV